MPDLYDIPESTLMWATTVIVEKLETDPVYYDQVKKRIADKVYLNMAKSGFGTSKIAREFLSKIATGTAEDCIKGLIKDNKEAWKKKNGE